MQKAIPNLVSAKEAHDLYQAGKARFIDASWYLDGTDALALFQNTHIPGAVFFDLDALSDTQSDLPHMLPTAASFAKAMAGLGLSTQDRIIIYDQQGLFSAPRVWWTLNTFGFERVSIMRGGLLAWRDAGYALTDQPPLIAPVPVQTLSFQTQNVISQAEIMAILGASQPVILDARPRARFLGQVPEPRPHLRSGHIPGAFSLPASELIRQGDLLPLAELEPRLAAFLKAPQIITTCGSGVTAAILTLALTELGHKGLRLYDGSWAQWGRPDGPPITV